MGALVSGGMLIGIALLYFVFLHTRQIYEWISIAFIYTDSMLRYIYKLDQMEVECRFERARVARTIHSIFLVICFRFSFVVMFAPELPPDFPRSASRSTSALRGVG